MILTNRDWCLGSEEFRQELLAQVTTQANPEHGGPEIQERARAKAGRIVDQELQSLGWTAEHLQVRRKGDPEKVRMAARLRQETTVTLAWIAERLCMGTSSHVACLLYRDKKNA